MEKDKTIYKRRIPLLGTVKCDAKGHYYVAEHSVVARAVGFRCPRCAKPILVRPSVAGRLTAVCRRCATPVIFFVDAAPSNVQGAPAPGHPLPPPLSNAPAPSVASPVRPLIPARLILGHWPNRREYPLREGRTTIGRKDAVRHADIEIDDPKASACSVCLTAVPVGGVGTGAPTPVRQRYDYRLQVVHATNPVFVNGIVVPPGGVVRLVAGSKIRLGDTSFRFDDK